MIIREVRSDRGPPRPVRLGRGANVILDKRSKKRAGGRPEAGRSPLAALCYCLGCGEARAPARPRPERASLSLDAEHGGRRFSVRRSAGDQEAVELEGCAESWMAPAAPAGAAAAPVQGSRSVGLGDYRRMLGRIMFGLDTSGPRGRTPTFEGLVSYCMRRGGGYRSPFRSGRRQARSDAQICNAYLLGLDWRQAAGLADARVRKRRLRELEREAALGMPEGATDSAQLEAIAVRLEDEVRREEDAIAAFKVHGEYARLEEEAGALAESMRRLAGEVSAQERELNELGRSAGQEQDESPDGVLAVYDEARVSFPESVRRRLEEAKEFHESVARSRREHIGSEIGRLGGEVREKGRRIGRMAARRAGIAEVLEAHGSADQLAALRARHRETAERWADASSRLGALRKIERECAAVNAGMVRMRGRAGAGLGSQRERRDAILAFDRCSEMVCGAPGRLSIGTREDEYALGAEIERPGGGGGGMEVLCYDLAIASLWAGRPQSPGFLAHDGRVFGGADGRQVARALQVAASESERLGIQYICAIDAGTVPYGEFDGGFDFDSLVAATLTDGGGGPLGN